MRNAKTAAEALRQVTVAFAAKAGLVWIVSREELRVERALAAQAKLMASGEAVAQRWTMTRGLEPIDSDGEETPKAEAEAPTGAVSMSQQQASGDNGCAGDPVAALVAASQTGDDKRTVTVFCDLAPYMKDNPVVVRAAKDANRMLPTIETSEAKFIVCIEGSEPPPGLEGVTVIDWPLPTRSELVVILDGVCEEIPPAARPVNGAADALISAALGLTAEGFSRALTQSWVDTQTLDVAAIGAEKKRLVRESGLEWYDPDPLGLDSIGGLDALKAWAIRREKTLGRRARERGVPMPRGIVLGGITGCGKSASAKAIATAWQMPLLRFDMAAMLSKWVGESEGKMKRALETAQAVKPCVLWIDEVEKAFATGAGDPTGTRIQGQFLTWMEEREDGVFVIATANDTKGLPSEFLRRKRWDQLWFVELPTTTERVAIADVMKGRFQFCDAVSATKVGKATAMFSGAEIESAFGEAVVMAFDDGERDTTTADVLEAIAHIQPLAANPRMAEKLAAMREAFGDAESASLPEKATPKRQKKATKRESNMERVNPN